MLDLWKSGRENRGGIGGRLGVEIMETYGSEGDCLRAVLRCYCSFACFFKYSSKAILGIFQLRPSWKAEICPVFKSS